MRKKILISLILDNIDLLQIIKKFSKLSLVIILLYLTQFVAVTSFNTQLTECCSNCVLWILKYLIIISSNWLKRVLGIIYLPKLDLSKFSFSY